MVRRIVFEPSIESISDDGRIEVRFGFVGREFRGAEFLVIVVRPQVTFSRKILFEFEKVRVTSLGNDFAIGLGICRKKLG